MKHKTLFAVNSKNINTDVSSYGNVCETKSRKFTKRKNALTKRTDNF